MPDSKILHPNLATALVAARAEFTPVKKTHTAKVVTAKGSYEYRFATLDEINDATQPALQKHGLAIVQKLSSPDGGNVGIQTVLLFGAESLDCGTLVMPTGGTPQSIGSACTYGRRYGVTAALMIATEDDDDGQQAQTATAKASPAPPARKPEVASHEVRPDPRQPGDEPDDPFGDLDDEGRQATALADRTAKSAQTNPAPASWPRITTPQQKRLFAVAMGAGWTKDGLREFLTAQGYAHSNEIAVAHYDDLVSAIQAGPKVTS